MKTFFNLTVWVGWHSEPAEWLLELSLCQVRAAGWMWRDSDVRFKPKLSDGERSVTLPWWRTKAESLIRPCRWLCMFSIGYAHHFQSLWCTFTQLHKSFYSVPLLQARLNRVSHKIKSGLWRGWNSNDQFSNMNLALGLHDIGKKKNHIAYMHYISLAVIYIVICSKTKTQM